MLRRAGEGRVSTNSALAVFLGYVLRLSYSAILNSNYIHNHLITNFVNNKLVFLNSFRIAIYEIHNLLTNQY